MPDAEANMQSFGRLSVRVLIVDANEDYAKATAALLRHGIGCDANVRIKGRDVRLAVETLRPHLLLLGLRMEDQDGLGVIAELKRLALVPPLVVAVSGDSTKAAILACLESGFDYHAVKPVSMDGLYKFASEALDRSLEPTSSS